MTVDDLLLSRPHFCVNVSIFVSWLIYSNFNVYIANGTHTKTHSARIWIQKTEVRKSPSLIQKKDDRTQESSQQLRNERWKRLTLHHPPQQQQMSTNASITRMITKRIGIPIWKLCMELAVFPARARRHYAAAVTQKIMSSFCQNGRNHMIPWIIIIIIILKLLMSVSQVMSNGGLWRMWLEKIWWTCGRIGGTFFVIFELHFWKYRVICAVVSLLNHPPWYFQRTIIKGYLYAPFISLYLCINVMPRIYMDVSVCQLSVVNSVVKDSIFMTAQVWMYYVVTS